MHPEFLFGVLLPRKWPRLTLSPVKHEHPVEDQAQSPMEEDLTTKASGMVTNSILVVTFSQAAVSFGYIIHTVQRMSSGDPSVSNTVQI